MYVNPHYVKKSKEQDDNNPNKNDRKNPKTVTLGKRLDYVGGLIMVDVRINIPEGFLNKEVRNGYTVTRQMKEVWVIELDLLCKLDEVCKRMGLAYFLDAGSLLGAIREKGFIPWDDDIDVVMFRDDFEQLISKGQQYFRKPYFLQSAYSDEGYYRCHAQLRNSNTTAMLPYEGKRAMINQGIFIDIFVLDGIPKEKKTITKTVKKQNWYRFIVRSMTAKVEYEKNKVKGLTKMVLGKLFKMIYHSPMEVYFASKAEAMRWENSEFVDKLWFRSNSSVNKIHYFKKEWFSQRVMAPFEWLQFPIPANYDDILIEYYGKDYMKPQQAPSTHGEMIFNTDISYRDYINKT